MTGAGGARLWSSHSETPRWIDQGGVVERRYRTALILWIWQQGAREAAVSRHGSMVGGPGWIRRGDSAVGREWKSRAAGAWG